MSPGPKTGLKEARIVVVDDEEANVRLLQFILESAGYQNICGITDSRRLMTACAEFNPDLFILDLHMPHIDGLSLIKLIVSEFPQEVYLPVLVITADISPEPKREALKRGAKDFLTKPFDATEVLLRAHNLLETRALYQEIAAHSQALEGKVRERTHELAEAQVEVLRRLALAAEYRDDDTGQHTRRVGMLSAKLGEAIGQSREEVELLRLAAPLHDVGKIGVPDRILLKAGKLTAEEMNIMQSHTTIGGEILGKSRFAVLQLARQIALSHHERWDALGYPQGIGGELIPLPARITAVADVFDALIHARPYKEAWPLERAVATINRESGRHFDPDLVSAFGKILNMDGLSQLMAGLDDEQEADSILNSAFVESLR